MRLVTGYRLLGMRGKIWYNLFVFSGTVQYLNQVTSTTHSIFVFSLDPLNCGFPHPLCHLQS